MNRYVIFSDLSSSYALRNMRAYLGLESNQNVCLIERGVVISAEAAMTI